MPSLEFFVRIERDDSVPAERGDLTAQEVEEAVRGALITKLGWSNVNAAENTGTLKIGVS